MSDDHPGVAYVLDANVLILQRFAQRLRKP